jgi:hypothetical protein
MGREGIEPSKPKLSHFECDAYTNFAIHPVITISLHKFIVKIKAIISLFVEAISFLPHAYII